MLPCAGWARGDTLSQIAERYDTRISTLVALNNLNSRHRIRIGQRLRLPAAGPAPTADAAPATTAAAVEAAVVAATEPAEDVDVAVAEVTPGTMAGDVSAPTFEGP